MHESVYAILNWMVIDFSVYRGIDLIKYISGLMSLVSLSSVPYVDTYELLNLSRK